jgi:perosamine synthetase
MHSKKKIPIFHPYVSNEAINNVVKVLTSRWIGQGDLVEEFEKALEKQLKLKNVVLVNSSSSALRLALSIIGVKPGNEVITTPMTCTLTNHPILEQFAKPIFADIKYESGNIDASDIEHRITAKTKAIICTHWGGMPCDLDEIHQIAKRNGLAVIEDASEAIGAKYKDKPIGNISPFTVFSFQAIQIITTGEGGALVTTNIKNSDLARIQRWFGIDRKRRRPNKVGYYDFDIKYIGFGFYSTNLNSALGLANISHLSELLKYRQKIADKYYSELSKVKGINLFKRYTDRRSSNHFFTVHVQNRNNFCKKMADYGIEVSIVHYRNDNYTIFGGLRKDLPNLDRFSQSYIALPNHMSLSLDDVDYIISTIKSGW